MSLAVSRTIANGSFYSSFFIYLSFSLFRYRGCWQGGSAWHNGSFGAVHAVCIGCFRCKWSWAGELPKAHFGGTEIGRHWVLAAQALRDQSWYSNLLALPALSVSSPVGRLACQLFGMAATDPRACGKSNRRTTRGAPAAACRGLSRLQFPMEPGEGLRKCHCPSV